MKLELWKDFTILNFVCTMTFLVTIAIVGGIYEISIGSWMQGLGLITIGIICFALGCFGAWIIKPEVFGKDVIVDFKISWLRRL